MHKTDKQAKANLSEAISNPLERRRSRPVKGSDNNGSCLVANAEEFKHILLKYCLRKQRDGRDFALAAFSILEHQSLLKDLGQTASDQLLNMVQMIVVNNIRDSDRLCNLSDGYFLLLLPDTNGKDAGQTLDRLNQSVSGAKTQYHKRSLHASLALKTIATDGGNIDAQALLNAIGYEIATDGKLCQEKGLAAGGASSDLSSWLNRYEAAELIETVDLKPNIKVRKLFALDTWQKDGKVCLLLIDLAQDNSQKSFCPSFLSRARVLQSINHPGVLPIDDYHLSANGSLAISYQFPAYISLEECLQEKNLTRNVIYSWLGQILNILIYLQGLIPPVVPSKITLANFSVSDSKQLLLSDYFLPYLFTALDGDESMPANADLSANSGTVFIAGFVSLLKDLARAEKSGKLLDEPILSSLVGALEQRPLPKSLNTLYKIRSHLHETLLIEN